MKASKELATLYFLYSVSFFASIIQNIYTPIIGDLKNDFSVPIVYINYTVGLFIWVVAIIQFILGKYIDGAKKKKMLLCSIVVILISTVICAFTHNFFVFGLFRIIQAIGCGAIPLIVLTLLSYLSKAEERSSVISDYQIILSLAPAIAPILGGFIGGKYSYQGIFIFLSFCALLILSACVLVKLPIDTKVNKDGISKRVSYTSLLKVKEYRVLLASGFIIFFTYFGILVFLPITLKERYDFSTTHIGLLFLPMTVSLILGSVFYKKAAKSYKNSYMMKLLLCSFTILVLSFGLLHSTNVVVFMILLFCIGFMVGLSPSLIATMITFQFENAKGAALGLFNFVRYSGMALGAISIGYIGNNYIVIYFSLIAIAFLILYLCCFRMKK